MISDSINIKDYWYDLPEDRIAQFPLKERDGSNLLIYNKGIISKDIFRNIPDYLSGDTLLVFNNTRVIRARLLFRKESGAVIEILCLEPLAPSDYQDSLDMKNPVEWKCIIGNLKKWKSGTVSSGFRHKGKTYKLTADMRGAEGEAWRIRFRWDPSDICFGEVLGSAGHIPLPPYIKREDNPDDSVRYQTVYSRIRGSVAAPTAGLHFTQNVLNDILNKGIASVEITLHVGAGTFQPIRQENILDHEMHREHFIVSEKNIEILKEHGGRIITVGTTSLRALESLYWIGVKCMSNEDEILNACLINQWYPYQNNSSMPFRESLEALLSTMRKHGLATINATTELLIVPGYEFRTVAGIITNFHQPGSTLLLLVAAFAGEDWKNIYRFAIENDFRFLSYGDCSLLIL